MKYHRLIEILIACLLLMTQALAADEADPVVIRWGDVGYPEISDPGSEPGGWHAAFHLRARDIRKRKIICVPQAVDMRPLIAVERCVALDIALAKDHHHV